MKNNIFKNMGLIVLLFSAISQAIFAETAPLPAQIMVNNYQRPALLKAENKFFLVYEMYLTNYMKTAATISSFRIENAKKMPLADLGALKESIQSRNPTKKDENRLRFNAGETKTLFVWLPFKEEKDLPQQLNHQLSIRSVFQEKPYVFNMGNYALSVDASSPIIIGAPLQGKNWLAGNGPSNVSDHRRTSMILDGKPYYAQRYAIDFVKMGKDGKSYVGDVHKNPSYHCYNQDVLAVADGRVVQIQDGLPENVPNSKQFALPISEKTLPGNYIVLDLGNGKYAGYAHLVPGSIKVKVGDSVKRQQVLAKLGNSGNSSEPHLHFQIMDSPSFIKSNGLPYGFAHFWARPTQLLSTESGSMAIKTAKLLSLYTEYLNQLVLENALMNFD